ncbi:hypothetical protein LA76x_3574 [Lysobacter antibioticus]|uniref:Uncharacterized protein n=1 Tax=Lysobacter antibioticus TaxID=84531 RepID=A0A0S2FDU7_LYSAN|nr:hypothetical protein LA76x_3574 [Lysobacter antibioticus]
MRKRHQGYSKAGRRDRRRPGRLRTGATRPQTRARHRPVRRRQAAFG